MYGMKLVHLMSLVSSGIASYRPRPGAKPKKILKQIANDTTKLIFTVWRTQSVPKIIAVEIVYE